MKERLAFFYRFLPIQLFLLHFRKYQLLLIFWLILFATIMGKFAHHFGAASLFLSPEYLGRINISSFFLLGGAMATFSMSWHITTFIIHSKRLPFLGATRHAFLKYCINNSILPLLFLGTYGIFTYLFLIENEQLKPLYTLLLLLSFYLGYIFILILSFSYFFKVDKDILKSALSNIANPALIRNIIPYDTLDRELDLIKADSYMDKLFNIKRIKTPYQYNRRLIAVVLRRHHRNAMFAVFSAFILLLILGVFMDKPAMRIPAGAGFLLLFTIMMTVLGAFKYFLRSWEVIGWLSVIGVISLLTYYKVFDLRSIAYGMKYKETELPEYSYQSAKELFTDSLYQQDKRQEIQRLDKWIAKSIPDDSTSSKSSSKRPLVVISVSGGGSRSAYWTFRTLQFADSLSGGKLFQNTVLISGASGGMIGAAYWRSIQMNNLQGNIKNPYDNQFQENMGKDLLNAVIFSLASVDFISPFNKITVAGRRYSKDRGYAFDNELISITDGILDGQLKDFQAMEKQGEIPLMVMNGTIINDGRKLLIASQPVSYLGRAESSLNKVAPIIDGIDFVRFFNKQDPYNLNLVSALRMSATFPIILPVTKLPAQPNLNIMDAGLRDNYGVENTVRYLHTFKDWIKENIDEVIFLQIRDTKQEEPSDVENTERMSSMLFDPIFAIQQKWSSFQTFHQTYVQDYLKDEFKDIQFNKIVIQYIPKDKEQSVALNFHLTKKEKQYLLGSILNQDNQNAFLQLKSILHPTEGIRVEKKNRKNELSHQ